MNQDICNFSSQGFIEEELQQQQPNCQTNMTAIKEDRPIREIIYVESNQIIIDAGITEENQKKQRKKPQGGKQMKKSQEDKIILNPNNKNQKRKALNADALKYEKRKKSILASLQQRKTFQLNIQGFKECLTSFNSGVLHTKTWQPYKIKYSVQQTHKISSFLNDFAQSILSNEKIHHQSNKKSPETTLEQIIARLKIASYRFTFSECINKMIELNQDNAVMKIQPEIEEKPLKIEEKPLFAQNSPGYNAIMKEKRQALQRRLYVSVQQAS